MNSLSQKSERDLLVWCPKIFQLFKGKTAFLGEKEDARRFFEDINLPIPKNYNPCDHFIEHVALIPGRETESYEKMYKICQAYEGDFNK